MHIQPGIESLATSTVKLMKKGASAFRNTCLLKFCAIYEVLRLQLSAIRAIARFNNQAKEAFVFLEY